MRGPFKNQGNRPAYVKKQKDSKREEGDRQKHQEYIDAINSIANKFATEQQQNSTSDSKRALREKVTIGLLVATVFAAGLGDWFFYGQKEEMIRAYGPIEVQANIARAQQRAWLGAPKISLAEPISYKDGIATFAFSIGFQNIGNSPTQGTFIKAELVPVDGDWRIVKDRVCQEGVAEVEKKGWEDNYAVAPDDTWSPRPYYPPLPLKVSGPHQPILVGCAFYGVTTDAKPTVHRTGFVASVALKGQPFGSDKIHFGSSSSIGADKIQVTGIYTVAPTN